MEYVFLIITVILCAAQNVFIKQYNVKTQKPDSLLFGAVSVLFALLFFVADLGIEHGFKFNYTPEILPYSIGFALTYSMAILGAIYAIQFGSLAVSALISSYSLLIPTFYGVFFLEEKLSYTGFALLCISIFLINKKDESSTVRFTLKWVIALAASFIGNGLCSTVQKMQQLAFKPGDSEKAVDATMQAIKQTAEQPYDYKNEFMIIALAISFIILLSVLLVSLKGKMPEKTTLKNSIFLGLPRGIANGIVNLLMIILASRLSATILYPTVSAGGIVLGFFIALFWYKERLSKIQLVGYGLGVVSVVLLNL